MILAGKNVVVYGAGKSGRAAYQMVREYGARAIIFDDDPGAQNATDSVQVFKDADIIVLSPGVDNARDVLMDAKLENKTVISELELASRMCRAQQIAVTGTNGKTTATMLINHILNHAKKRSVAVGNIGTPFSAVADRLDALETAVIEASSFQLESAEAFSPDIAVLLNITPDHLERHGTMKKYIAAKSNIFIRQCECDKVVYNADDVNIASLTDMMRAKKIPFSMTSPVDGAYISSGFACYKGIPVVEIEETDMRGREIEDLLAAVAVATEEGVSAYTIAEAVCCFRRPEYRRALSGEIDGIKIFNDSKATNVESALSALSGMSGGAVQIMGGCLRKEDFDDFFDRADADELRAVAVFGENAEVIARAAESHCVRCERASDLAHALACALSLAKEYGAKNVLFSPASKSFDAYSGYEERGRAFDIAVRALIR